MNEKEKYLFEWYKLLIDLGKYEVDLGRTKFYETVKIHMIISGAILTLGSYALTKNDSAIFFLSALVSIFGIVNAIYWLRQISSASTWESKWYLTAAKIEKTKEFKGTVGVSNIKAWSDEKVMERLEPEIKKTGASPKLYKVFVISFVVFYSLLAIGSILYGFFK